MFGWIRRRVCAARERRRFRGIEPESLLLRRWQGEQPAPRPGGRLAIFAHHDPDGLVDESVVDYLHALSQLGASTIFVSATENLDPEEVRRVLPSCWFAVQRRNLGLDFGSWKTGLDLAGDLGDLGQLVLANDSVYGPLRPLDGFFRSMEGRHLDLWGATSSRDRGWHVQSYFVVFESRAIRSRFFRQFWGDFVFLATKPSVVHYCELGLSRAARRQGLALGAFVEERDLGRLVRQCHPSHQFARHPRRPNPTIHFWELLLSDFAFPFLKTEVPRLNRVGSRAAQRWERYLPAEQVEKIRKHLARLRRDRAPAPLAVPIPIWLPDCPEVASSPSGQQQVAAGLEAGPAVARERLHLR